MDLCSLCQRIPFSSLPTPRKHRSGRFIGDREELVQLFYKDGERPSEVPPGFPWHDDLDSLTKCATTGCSLCALVQAGVQTWIDHYNDVSENNQWFNEFHKDCDPFPGGKRLWLTKRYGGADGFVVLAENPNLDSGVYLLTGVGFSVDSGSRLADIMPLRPLEAFSGSSSSLEVAKAWMRNCLGNHESCLEGDVALPSRVLDVESSGEVVKLATDTRNIRGKYACLSYCWGISPDFITSKESFKDRQSGIRLSDLPKTFLDAVTITRHLGLRYLWIDSLCILQDSSDDWARESVRMTDIYSKAHIVISVNHANDKSVGCFHHRPLPETTISGLHISEPQGSVDEIHMTVLQVKCESPLFTGEFNSEPLSRRGWALQERVLSRRSLHYNSQQMYFECNHGVFGEDGCRTEFRCHSIDDTVNDDAPPSKPRHETSHAMWNDLLWAYGPRELARATDKLPALSGLARLFQQRLNAEYVAGLWSDTLIEGLAWQGLGANNAMNYKEYTGPSWSWASYRGIAATGLQPTWADTAEILDWHIELENEANPYGQVKNASIRLRAPVAKLFVRDRKTTKHDTRLVNAGVTPLPRLHTSYSDDNRDDQNGIQVRLDHKAVRDSGEWRHWDLCVLLLGGYRQSTTEIEGCRMHLNNESMGLVLAKHDDRDQMKRVGFMFVLGNEAEKIRKDDSAWTTSTLV